LFSSIISERKERLLVVYLEEKVAILLCSFAVGGDDWKDIGVPVIVAAGSLGLVILAVVVIWRLINRDNQYDQRQRPRHNGYGGVDQTINVFNEPNEGGSSGNVAQPISASSGSDNVTFDKTYNAQIGSVPV